MNCGGDDSETELKLFVQKVNNNASYGAGNERKEEGKVEANAEAKVEAGNVEENASKVAAQGNQAEIEGDNEADNSTNVSVFLRIWTPATGNETARGPFYGAWTTLKPNEIVTWIINSGNDKNEEPRVFRLEFESKEEMERFQEDYKIIHVYYIKMINLQNDREVENTNDVSFESATSVASTDTAPFPNIEAQERAQLILASYSTSEVEATSDGSSVGGGSHGNVTPERRDPLSVEDATKEENGELEKITGALAALRH